MQYDEFRAAYDPVSDVLGPKTLPSWLPDSIARLKELAATIEDPADRRTAKFDIADVEGILDEGLNGLPASAALLEAIDIYGQAARGEGTSAERIARAEAGMTAIGKIAEANPSEEASIMDLNESLYMLILSLRAERDCRVSHSQTSASESGE